jgi:site-specific recombinase XerD
LSNARLIDAFLLWLASGALAPSTLRQRRYILTAFAREHDVCTATAEDVTAYLADPKRGPNGKRTVISALRVFYGWLEAKGHVDHNPMRLVHQVREDKGMPKPVPADVFERALLDANTDGDVEAARMLMLGYYAGLRLSEIAAFHSKSITDVGLVIKGKGRVTRRVPVHPRLAPYLEGIHGYAFPSWRKPGRHVGESYVAGKVESRLGAPWTTHCLRHAFGTRLYEASRDIRCVQILMGHSSVNTTQRYVQIATGKLDAAINAVA